MMQEMGEGWCADKYTAVYGTRVDTLFSMD